MKFRMYFGWLKTTLVSVVILAGVVVVVLDAVMLSGEVSALITANKPVAGVSLAAGALLTIAASLLLGNSYYKFRDDELFVMMGVFGDYVEYDTVRKIAVNAVTGEIFVISEKPSEDGAPATSVNIRLNLTAKGYKDILPELEKRCAFAVVETFTPPEKKKKDK